MSSVNYLEIIPNEVLHNICSYLSNKDIENLSKTDKKLREFVFYHHLLKLTPPSDDTQKTFEQHVIGLKGYNPLVRFALDDNLFDTFIGKEPFMSVEEKVAFFSNTYPEELEVFDLNTKIHARILINKISTELIGSFKQEDIQSTILSNLAFAKIQWPKSLELRPGMLFSMSIKNLSACISKGIQFTEFKSVKLVYHFVEETDFYSVGNKVDFFAHLGHELHEAGHLLKAGLTAQLILDKYFAVSCSKDIAFFAEYLPKGEFKDHLLFQAFNVLVKQENINTKDLKLIVEEINDAALNEIATQQINNLSSASNIISSDL